MSLPIAIPINIDASTYGVLQAITRRAIDGTVVPILVDYTNQRILIGSTSASASPAKLEVTGGDIKIVTAGSGVIIANRAGTAYYRLIIENNGAISADQL